MLVTSPHRALLTTATRMITGEIRSQIDAVWNAFWTGGISNPLEVIEQITYLLFLRRLDDLHTLAESKAAELKRPFTDVAPHGPGGLFSSAQVVELMAVLAGVKEAAVAACAARRTVRSRSSPRGI